MATFGTFDNPSLSEQIAERILNLIKDKKLKPGDKLPAERELAQAMQVSRPSLREALRALSIINVVEIRHGSGTYVCHPTPEALLGKLDIIFESDESTFIDLYEARCVVEVGIIALAAERITPENLAKLEAFHQECLCERDEVYTFLDMDIDFHRLITQSASNPILNRFMDMIAQINAGRRRRRGLHSSIHIEETIQEHATILAALKSGDAEAAQDALINHLDNGKRRLLQLLETRQEPRI